MYIFLVVCLLCIGNLAFGATSNVTLTIPVVNQSHHPLCDISAMQFISLNMLGDIKGGAPETLWLNMDPYKAPTYGQLIITRPFGSAFKFALSFDSAAILSTPFCSFEVKPLSVGSDDISLIQNSIETPVKCSYSIDNITHQPTILIEDNT